MTLFGGVGVENGNVFVPARDNGVFTIPADDTLLNGARLELCKAKAFGVHTGMYYLDNLLAKRGKTLTFTWAQD